MIIQIDAFGKGTGSIRHRGNCSLCSSVRSGNIVAIRYRIAVADEVAEAETVRFPVFCNRPGRCHRYADGFDTLHCVALVALMPIAPLFCRVNLTPCYAEIPSTRASDPSVLIAIVPLLVTDPEIVRHANSRVTSMLDPCTFIWIVPEFVRLPETSRVSIP